MTVTAEDIARTGVVTTRAQWGVASVVMTGSAASAWVAFAQLGEHPAIGAVTAIGVDLALASGLVIGRRLRAVGITTGWGTVLLWLTSAMTLCLNSGAAAVTGRWALAVAHAFLPVLLVVLTEAGSEAQLKLLQLRRETDAAEQTEKAAQSAADRDVELRRAASELVTAQDTVVELRRVVAQAQAEAAALRATTSRAATAKPTEPRHAPVVVKQTLPSKVVPRAQRRQWVLEQLSAGRTPTGAEVDERFGPPAVGSKARTGAAIVREAKDQFEPRSLHVVQRR